MNLKGLKLHLDLKVDALDADIKSLKKAARQNVAPEILRRIEQIIKNNNVQLNDDFKISWNGYSIAQLIPGKDYLNPDIKLIIDDMIENEDQTNLIKYLTNWIHNKIKDELKNLLDLKNIENSNSLVRALAFRIYEGNGVVKRNEVENFLEYISKFKNLDIDEQINQFTGKMESAKKLTWNYSELYNLIELL